MIVMLVDDDNDIRELLQQFLEMEGYTVRAYAQGRAALDSLATGGELPRVILLDWRMPNMSGSQFLEEYQTLEAKNSTPVYIFSAENDARLSQDTRALGVLKKPVDFNALLSALEDLS